MARSADRRLAAAFLAVAALAALAGCDTTQRQNERAKLTAKREIASRTPLRVTAANPQVRVTGVTLLSRRGRTSVVVDLRSDAARPLTDLPIAVGVRTPHGRTVALNAGTGLEWFQTHVPAIAAHGALSWVFAAPRRDALAGRPFATVGVPASPPLSTARALPQIAVSALPGADRRDAAARVLVENASSVPQYGLQVYALARSAGRYVVAGRVSIAHLGTGERRTVGIPLTAPVPSRSLRLHAVPTIFK